MPATRAATVLGAGMSAGLTSCARTAASTAARAARITAAPSARSDQRSAAALAMRATEQHRQKLVAKREEARVLARRQVLARARQPGRQDAHHARRARREHRHPVGE